MASNSEDPFDDLLNLEDRFYSEGYAQGVADGDRAGRLEGRSFGIEKGFEKFVEAGRLYGKSVVWANRLGPSPPSSFSSSAVASLQQEQQEASISAAKPTGQNGAEAQKMAAKQLPRLTVGGARLEKNIVTLHALVEPDTLSTENTDEAVQDFDDRVKRAQGKARVIERQVGEDGGSGGGGGGATTTTAAAAAANAPKQQKRENIRPKGSTKETNQQRQQEDASSSSLAEDLLGGF